MSGYTNTFLSDDQLSKKEAIEFLRIDKKEFENYHKKSREITGKKVKKRWKFDKKFLEEWKNKKKNHTVSLSHAEYVKCFVFAIQMAYSKSSSAGTGIRGGTRSEMQQADDWIMGILAEFGLKKFLKIKYGIKIKLDTKAHPGRITAQDIVEVDGNTPGIRVAVKSSKAKSGYLVLDPSEYDKEDRKADVYVFARLYLPSDHLFRVLRDHLFFKCARKLLDKKVKNQNKQISKDLKIIEKDEKKLEEIRCSLKDLRKIEGIRARKVAQKKLRSEIKLKSKKIKELRKKIPKLKVFKKIEAIPEKIPVWICGFSEHSDLDKRSEIPGQKFTKTDAETGESTKSYRYVKSVAKMKNSEEDWKKFAKRLRMKKST